MKKDYAWITWERQQRNIAMSELLDADYFEFDFKCNIFLRYIKCISATLKVFNKGYKGIFVQSPSFILMVSGVLLSNLFRTQIIVDAHNAGVFPLEGRFSAINKLNWFFLKYCDLVIVSNGSLKEFLIDKNIKAISCPDPLPRIDPEKFAVKKDCNIDVFIICSWSDDEPIELYISVVKDFPEYQFYFTGNYKKSSINLDDFPRNGVLLGYISESEYFSYLKSARLVLDLTTRENCLVCGAYEAILFQRPLILTDSFVNRELFDRGVLLVRNDREDLASSISAAFAKDENLTKGLSSMRSKLKEMSIESKNDILEYLS